MEYIGTVSRCKHGKLGLITDYTQYSNNKEKWTIYTGIKLEEPGKWQSQEPKIVFNSLTDYMASVKTNKRPDLVVVDGKSYINGQEVIPCGN